MWAHLWCRWLFISQHQRCEILFPLMHICAFCSILPFLGIIFVHNSCVLRFLGKMCRMHFLVTPAVSEIARITNFYNIYMRESFSKSSMPSGKHFTTQWCNKHSLLYTSIEKIYWVAIIYEIAQQFVVILLQNFGKPKHSPYTTNNSLQTREAAHLKQNALHHKCVGRSPYAQAYFFWRSIRLVSL